MEDKLKNLQQRFEELERLLQAEATVSDAQKIKALAQEYEDLRAVINIKKRLDKIRQELIGLDGMMAANQDDGELKKISLEEKMELLKAQAEAEQEIKLLLAPQDPNDKKNVIVEIRAGAGGDEAALFAAELFRLYARFAERNKWRAKLLSANRLGTGGFKEVIFEIIGHDAYGALKFESGVHRVQRVPTTEKKGRVHTSTVTVAVLPEAEEVDLVIDHKDLKLDTFCAGGHGGQSVNTTYSAVRITHLPTGLVVNCQDERSQLQNKEKAMLVLRSRLLALKKVEEDKKMGETRKSQIGTGDRSEKIRTYNFPQDRLTDHRLNQNFSNILKIMDGDLMEITALLKEKATQKALTDD